MARQRTSTRVETLLLHTTQGDAGTLHRESQFVVRYNDIALDRPELAIALTMPTRPEGWTSNQLSPVLAMNLPEGFLLERVLDRYRKVMVVDDMNLLALTSTPSAGRVWASVVADSGSTYQEGEQSPSAMPLRDILAHPGTEDLFDELLIRFASTSISGVQPKVVVTEEPEPLPSVRRALPDRASIKSPDLIVKSAGDRYPGLAENEYICMSLARAAGLEVPDFWLSEDRKLFVIRRFDIAGQGGYLGFEDMAALMGKHPSKKYESTYADVAQAIADFAAPAHVNTSLEQFFRLLVLCCVVRNGDAHLKNFGVIYGDPASAGLDARLAPVYDVVCTTVYLSNDVLALGLRGSRKWPDRKSLERFGAEVCGVKNVGRVVGEIMERTMGYRYPDSESDMWEKVRTRVEAAIDSLRPRNVVAARSGR